MSGRSAVQYGPTAATVAANVYRLRKSCGLSIYSLSDRLGETGRPITPSAIGKIERQERQVTVDDLAALAVALGTSPSALLLPLTDDPAAKIEITGAGRIPADQAWDWMDGRRRLDQPTADPTGAALLYAIHSRPPIRRNREISGT
ncbi:helix-turn-helix transcriptional regulator [Streptomyces tuirus]|uniref:helix-turn-helix domain-containing protein n=1 Tax=Streptomyces tuirus TaxID=68278 RepID=UPI00343BE982